MPQDLGKPGKAKYPNVLRPRVAMKTVPLGIIKNSTLLEMDMGRV